MAKSKERFQHGEHNEEVCDLLALNQKFSDWTITTAFYAALHFVSYKIFPFSYKADKNIILYPLLKARMHLLMGIMAKLMLKVSRVS